MSENPPAFPASIGLDGSIYEGMDLRDYFAGQVAATTMTHANILENAGRVKEGGSFKVAAALAYALADAMLAERKRHD